MQAIDVQQPTKPNSIKAPNPKKLSLDFDYTPSSDGINFNLLILLHGLGKN